MGPTFIKLGQILATRVDLFDAEWIAEFSRLQDSAPTVPWAEIHAQLSVDLGAPPEEIFATIDPQPLAAASVAQVHRARLEDGSEVIVKVRRPCIRPPIEGFSEIVRFLEDSDLVKFARFMPVESDCKAALARGQSIVHMTIPPQITESPDKEAA